MKIEVGLKVEGDSTTLELKTANAKDRQLLLLATSGKKLHGDLRETEEGCFLIRFVDTLPPEEKR